MMYRVSGLMTISVYIDVEADSIREARDIANDASNMHLCHSCSTGSDEQWSTSGELDGTAEITDVEPVEDEDE